jgi:hypothetical protein
MHQAPAPVDSDIVEQPCQRPLPAPGFTLRYLLLLLGDVDVDGRRGVQPVKGLDHLVQQLGADGTQ